MKRLILILFALMCAIGAKGQVDDSEIAKKQIKYVLDTYAKRNCKETICLEFEYSAKEPNQYGYTAKLSSKIEFPILEIDTIQNEIVLRVALGFNFDTEKFVTITGTQEQIQHWTKNPFKTEKVSYFEYLQYYYHTDDLNIDFQKSDHWNFIKKNNKNVFNHFIIMSL